MTTPLLQDGSIIWGDVQLHGPAADGLNYTIETTAEGTSFGDPIPIIEQVASLAIDGALAARTGWENRDIPVRIKVSANDGQTHALIEAMLTAQVLMDRPPPLVYTPRIGNAAPAVFDVLVADMQRDVDGDWDLDEAQRGDRFWLLTLTCLPFARTVDTVKVSALTPTVGSPTVTSIDGCTSTTNWTATTNLASPTGPTVVGGGLRAAGNAIGIGQFATLVRTVATSTTLPYLVLDVYGTGTPSTWSVTIDGVRAPILSTIPGAGESASAQVYVAAPSGGSFTTLAITASFAASTSTKAVTATVYNVAQTNYIALPGSTSRELARQAQVMGSMPTRAAIRLFDATPAALGDNILIYTSNASDWVPSLRQYLKSPTSGITSDSTMVSGAHHKMDVASVFRFPALLLTEAAYALMARINCTIAGTLTWQAKLVDSTGANIVGSGQVLSGSVTVPVTTGLTTTGYQVLDLADRLQLPPAEVETSDYYVQVTVTGTTNMNIDEAWLLDLDNGAATWIQDTDGLQWIEIRSPELGAARPSVFGGTGAVGAKSVCVDWKCQSFGAHRFEPGPLNVFTMTTSSLVSQCELEYFPRSGWHPSSADTDGS